MKKIKYLTRRVLAILAMFWPGSWAYGNCLCCRIPWNFTKPSNGPMYAGNGCEPLCAACNKRLDPKEKVLYYEDLFQRWIDSNNGRPHIADWHTWKKNIIKQVLDGK